MPLKASLFTMKPGYMAFRKQTSAVITGGISCFSKLLGVAMIDASAALLEDAFVDYFDEEVGVK